MKKKLNYSGIAILVLICVNSFSFTAKAFSGLGSGTSVDPYQISSADQLNEVRNNLSACYQLTSNIDLTSWITTNSPTTGWLPIGNSGTPFSGTFDGNGHVISGLWINASTTDFVGLFGYVYGTNPIQIKKLGVLIASQGIIGQNSVGTIIGYIGYSGTTYPNVTIQSVFVQGNVSGATYAGAIVGRNIGNLTLTNTYAGGGTITATAATGIAGGLVSSSEKNTTTTITNCYVTNSVVTGSTSGSLAAGIIALIGASATTGGAYATISNCVTINPSITGRDNSGAIGRIYAWYKGDTYVSLTTSQNYAYEATQVNGTVITSGTATNKSGLNRTSTELKTQSTYTGITWDFNDVWQMGNGDYSLPVLKNISLDKQPTSAIFHKSLKIPSIISDNMILQQNTTVRIWGKAKPGMNVNIKADWNNANVTVNAGVDSCWETTIQTIEAGGPYSIVISSDNETKKINNILLGEVWICAGQSNITMPLKGWVSDGMPIEGSAEAIAESATYNDLRMITVARAISDKKEFNMGGTWQLASSNAQNFSAIGYFYALELRKKLGVPVGMIHLSWPGSTIQAWTNYDVLKLFPEINLTIISQSTTLQQRTPTVLFNAMSYPVSKFTVKGIIWYQGEDNVGANSLYDKAFPAMVKNWRNLLGLGNIPFYFVELAPYKYQGSNLDKSAYLREVQFESQYSIPNAAMATTGDVGEEENIHPAHKKEVAQRLAYWSLLKTYGFNEQPYTSIYTPVYIQKVTIDNKIILTFNCASNGLVLQGDPKTVFEIAGDDNVFYPADAKITGQSRDQLEIWSDAVSNPKQVHYCFKNFFESVLFNNYMIPASPFRTESISGISSAIDVTKENNLIVYPNPTKGKLYVKEESTGEKFIYNVMGDLSI